MSLQNILVKIASEHGVTLTDSRQLALTIDQINSVAKELYSTVDFPEAIREGIFDVNVSSQMVALPSSIENIRGIRYHRSFFPVKLDDQHNRYNYNPEAEVWNLQWRYIGISATMRDLDNESQLVITLPLEETEEFTVTISGSTPNSSKYTEDVTVPVGTKVVNTAQQFTFPVGSISKDKITKYDVKIYSVDGNLLAVIPNYLTQSLYRLIQIMDSESSTVDDSIAGVEIQYVLPFVPFSKETDLFIGTDRYDDAIFWRWCAHRAPDAATTQIYTNRSMNVINNIHAKDSIFKRRRINFKPAGVVDLPYWKYGIDRRYCSV